MRYTYSVTAGDNSTTLPVHHFFCRSAAIHFASKCRGNLSCDSSAYVTVYRFEDGDDQGHTSKTIRAWRGTVRGKWFSAKMEVAK